MVLCLCTGLYAAYCLLKEGVDVIVLEGRKRVGGRNQTCRVRFLFSCHKLVLVWYLTLTVIVILLCKLGFTVHNKHVQTWLFLFCCKDPDYGYVDLGAGYVGPSQNKILEVLSHLNVPVYRTPIYGKSILWHEVITLIRCMNVIRIKCLCYHLEVMLIIYFYS